MIGRIAASLRRRGTRYFAETPAPSEDGTAEASRVDRASLNHEQAHAVLVRTWLFAFSGIGTALLMALDFHACLGLGGIALATGIIVTYLVWLAAGLDWRRTSDDSFFLRISARLLLLLGFLWGALVIALGLRGGPPSSVPLMALMMALISTPMLSTPLSVAMAFWIPTTLACVFTIVRIQPLDPYMLACFLGYVGFTALGIAIVNRSLLDRAVGRISLQRQGETLDLLLDAGSASWPWETDAAMTFVRVDAAFAAALGASTSEVAGRRLGHLLSGMPATGPGTDEVARLLESRSGFRELVVAVEIAGEARWWSLTGRPVQDRGGFAGYKGIAADVTELRRAELRMQALATIDSLTGIVNRRAFEDRLDEACRRCTDAVGAAAASCALPCRFAVVLMDLDRFKDVNDTYGHAAGDDLLRAVAFCIARIVGTHGVVARFGGDEFAMLIEAADGLAATRVVDDIRAHLARSAEHGLELPDGERIDLAIGASFGVALCPAHGNDRRALLRDADLALYEAKERGRNACCVFDHHMGMTRQRHFSLQVRLRRAVERGTLRVEFDPTVDLSQDRLVALEAALAWNDPSDGRVGEALIRSLGYDTALLASLFRTLTEASCRTAARWPAPVRVTLSPQALAIDPGVIADALGAIDAAGSPCPLARFELVLPEAGWRRVQGDVRDKLAALRARGLGLGFDDLGAGSLDLDLFRALPLDVIRLDAGLVRRIGREPGAAGMVQWLAGLGRSLGVRVVAKGVDNDATIASLAALGIREASGIAVPGIAPLLQEA